MAALTNYDKWQHVGDDEAEAEAAAAPPRPVVTRLDGASTITVGGGGWSAAPSAAPAAAPKRAGIDYGKWDAFVDSESEGEENRYIDDDVFREREAKWKAAAARQPAAAAAPPRETVEDATASGGTCAKDGAFVAAWSQTAEDVVARFLVPAGTRGRDVAVSTAYDFEAKACVLTVRAPGGVDFRAPLAHDVWAEDDGRPDFRLAVSTHEAAALGELDWTLEAAPPPFDDGAKCARVALKKRPLAKGVVTWWPRLFAEGGPFDEVDLDTAHLAARAKRRPHQKRAEAASFADAWAGAHASFSKAVADRPPPVEIALED